MEETNIRKYAQLMQDLDLTGLEISENGATLRLERAPSVLPGVSVPVMAPTAASPASVPPSSPTAEAGEPGLISVCSPMVGVFYTAAAENQRPFVSVGDNVHKGDVICIIESMKLMNEITSDYDGTITEICVGNQQVVDYGHVLFRIRKETP
ncbi:MAG: acetyl-CoA carboxylase, biotin carboxyl carrier protein [Evtepia sp.]|jgi:acetyl-CoA carboxylase biotin carboxyl carrier protein|nr:acetyl-CoA carboxylase, biotin carboxyl carrier protein [Evtepia sp.]